MSEPNDNTLTTLEKERMRKRWKRGEELRKELNLPEPNPLFPHEAEQQEMMIGFMIAKEEREGKLK